MDASTSRRLDIAFPAIDMRVKNSKERQTPPEEYPTEEKAVRIHTLYTAPPYESKIAP